MSIVKHFLIVMAMLSTFFVPLSGAQPGDQPSAVDNQSTQAFVTVTDEDGNFSFESLSAGNYTLEAHRLILGAMHYMCRQEVEVNGNVENLTLNVSRCKDEQYELFENSTVSLDPGNFTISGKVFGPNRPGATPAEIPYGETTVKITKYRPLA